MTDHTDAARQLQQAFAEAAAMLNQPSWHNKRRTFGDAVLCLLGLHQTAYDGRLRDGLMVERCSCGATRLGRHRPWLRETWWVGPRDGWR